MMLVVKLDLIMLKKSFYVCNAFIYFFFYNKRGFKNQMRNGYGYSNVRIISFLKDNLISKLRNKKSYPYSLEECINVYDKAFSNINA